MTLYLDTSALVKLYIAEAHSGSVRDAVHRAARVGTSRVAYPEARAALARRQREGGLTTPALRGIVSDLDRDFPRMVVVEVGEHLAARAGELAERRGLRGFDAIHLTSALELRDLVQADLTFLAFDDRLSEAASAEGLRVPRTAHAP